MDVVLTSDSIVFAIGVGALILSIALKVIWLVLREAYFEVKRKLDDKGE